jgi:hypothetical protein
MRVVAPKGGNIGYFMKQGILCSAPMMLDEQKLDLKDMIVVDYFDPDTDMEEAFNALSLLEKYQDENGEEL